VKAPGDESIGAPPSATPSSLLERLRATDDGLAWERLVKLYRPAVVGWCHKAGVSAEDSADICQEVFQAVARGIVGFRHDRPADSFRGWLYTITRRRLLDHWRRAARQPQATGDSEVHDQLMNVPAAESPGLEAADTWEEYQRGVRLIRGEFEERTWEAFWRMTVDGRKAAEVAAELGMTPGAVYVAKSRVLRRLRERFAGLLDPPANGGNDCPFGESPEGSP
jgi:RNA polymerase sigma-70 factor (ECF subfamily)